MWRLSTSLFRDDEEDQDDDFSLESDGICSLSTMQRLYAFAACILGGVVLMFLSLIVFAKPIKFAILFSFGNILAVGSTAFLLGPVEQVRMMFDPVRMYATVIYIGSVAVALICALWIHSKILTIVAIICEVCALIWYSLSYIPFARRAVSQLMVRLCDTEL
ncbi:hypothetical protein QQ045_027421 [Rhodiola kirilowii]